VKNLSHRATLLVTFGYDGEPFFGLQPQPGHPTAGGALKARLTEAAGQPPRGLAFAARTDRGVHALATAATCWFPADAIDVGAVAARVADHRDDHLTVHAVHRVDAAVHARTVSVAKHYRYRIVDGADPAAADAGHERAWHVVPRLDEKAMQAGAEHLVGTFDFTSLRGGGCSAATPVKTITRLAVHRGHDDVIEIDVEGNAFLRHMVRNLAGLLVEVGSGWRDAATVPAVIAARHRQAAGLQAPAGGLTLVELRLRDASGWHRLAGDGGGRAPLVPDPVVP
jgi:tRNA pseudouridine38-40 synthase